MVSCKGLSISILLLALLGCLFPTQATCVGGTPAKVFPTVCRLAVDVEGDGIIDGYGTCVPYLKRDGAVTEYLALTASHCYNGDSAKYFVEIFIPTDGLYSSGKYLQAPAEYLVKCDKLDVGVVSFNSIWQLETCVLSNTLIRSYDPVISISCPLGCSTVMTEGYIAYKEDDSEFYCSAEIYEGSSGGAVINKDTRELVGISTAIRAAMYNTTQVPIFYLHLFVPITSIKPWLQEEGLLK